MALQQPREEVGKMGAQRPAHSEVHEAPNENKLPGRLDFGIKRTEVCVAVAATEASTRHSCMMLGRFQPLLPLALAPWHMLLHLCCYSRANY